MAYTDSSSAPGAKDDRSKKPSSTKARVLGFLTGLGLLIFLNDAFTACSALTQVVGR